MLRQLPDHIRVVIDHLGTCHVERGAGEPSIRALLDEARRRGNVWFKVPGYRTSTIVDDVVPFVKAIVHAVGTDRMLLSDSDAPLVGSDSQGRGFASHFNTVSALEFCEAVASAASTATGQPWADQRLAALICSESGVNSLRSTGNLPRAPKHAHPVIYNLD